jgi:hypothetical protein
MRTTFAWPVFTKLHRLMPMDEKKPISALLPYGL